VKVFEHILNFQNASDFMFLITFIGNIDQPIFGIDFSLTKFITLIGL